MSHPTTPHSSRVRPAVFMFLVLVPISVFVLTKAGRLMKRATRRLLERMANLYKILQETFLGIRVVKAFTMEPYERRRFRSAARDYCHKAVWVVNLDALASPIIEFLGVAAVGAAFLAGAYLVLENETHLFSMRMTNRPLDYQTLFFLYFLLASIADPVRKLSSVYTRIQSGWAAADRIFTPHCRYQCAAPSAQRPQDWAGNQSGARGIDGSQQPLHHFQVSTDICPFRQNEQFGV